jgi:hypothetical protein
LAVLPALATPAEVPVAELERRLSAEGVEKLNTYLGAGGAAARVSLHHATARCELQAVSLTVRLARDSRSKVVEAHGDALRLAVGSCTGFVLALLDLDEVPKVCASVASWSVMQTVRELRRRMRAIDADEVLHSSPRGKACHAAYLYELQNTRVGLRAGPPSSAPAAR